MRRNSLWLGLMGAALLVGWQVSVQNKKVPPADSQDPGPGGPTAVITWSGLADTAESPDVYDYKLDVDPADSDTGYAAVFSAFDSLRSQNSQVPLATDAEWDLDDDGTYGNDPGEIGMFVRGLFNEGEHTVSLRVTDLEGAVGTTSVTFAVEDADDRVHTWYHVASSGNDSTGTGLVGAPYATLGKALDVGLNAAGTSRGNPFGVRLNKGDTFNLEDGGFGTQPSLMRCVVTSYGTGASPILSISDTRAGGNSFLTMGDSARSLSEHWLKQLPEDSWGHAAYLSGVDVTRTEDGTPPYYGIHGIYSSGCQIQNCVFTDCGINQFGGFYNVKGLMIQDCTIDDNEFSGVFLGDAFFYGILDCIISDNGAVVSNSGGHGIYSSHCADGLILGNTITGTQTSETTGRTSNGVKVRTSERIFVVGNTITGTRVGVAQSGDPLPDPPPNQCIDCVIDSNVFKAQENDSVLSLGQTSRGIVKNNLIYGIATANAVFTLGDRWDLSTNPYSLRVVHNTVIDFDVRLLWINDSNPNLLASLDKIVFRNNVFYDTDDARTRPLIQLGAHQNITDVDFSKVSFDYNHWYITDLDTPAAATDTDFLQIYGTGDGTTWLDLSWNDFQASPYSQEANGAFNTDPLFTNAALDPPNDAFADGTPLVDTAVNFRLYRLRDYVGAGKVGDEYDIGRREEF